MLVYVLSYLVTSEKLPGQKNVWRRRWRRTWIFRHFRHFLK